MLILLISFHYPPHECLLFIFSAYCFWARAYHFKREIKIPSWGLPFWGCQHLFPKAYLFLPNLPSPHTRPPKTWVVLLLLVFTHSICSPWRTGASLPQLCPQAGSSPSKLQAKYTWNSLNSQVIGSNKHSLETSSRYIIPMLVFNWEGEFSHSYDKQSQLMLKYNIQIWDVFCVCHWISQTSS